MEMVVRIILLALGVIIMLGMAWDFRKKAQLRKNSGNAANSLNLKNAQGLNDADFDDVRLVSTSDKNETAEDAGIPEQIIALHVMAREPNRFSGKKLKQAFKDANLQYGDRQIFHRYDQTQGRESTLFSVVSSVEPGFFDLATLETLQTPGITLFFITTTPNQSVYAFELMLRAAKQLAMRLEGELQDERYAPLTGQTIEQYRLRLKSRGLRVLAG